MSSPSTLILGAGLSGLSLAYLLKKAGKPFRILEARSRYGGRIYTRQGQNQTPMEMGATWLGDKHRQLNQLLNELNLPRFAQHTTGICLFEPLSVAPPQQFFIPDTEAPSYRIEGGSSRLIERLVAEIGAEAVQLATKVTAVRDLGEQLEVQDERGERHRADRVVSTLPPQLLLVSLQFDPPLPVETQALCRDTPTWMGSSIKFVVEYARPFWRERGFSGAAFSNSGIASEIHDHCDATLRSFALKGFLNGGAAGMAAEERKGRVIAQLSKYFGPSAADYLSYNELIWSQEPLTHHPYDHYLLPHQNSGHPQYQIALLGGKFFISGSETSPYAGGYMNGAVAAAYDLLQQL
ncbi:MAG: FAD-dependent oxidoreductase [Bacteroidota bacterium]